MESHKYEVSSKLSFALLFFSISEILIFQVDKSESTNTGFRLFLIIEFAVEIIVNDGIIISSFFFKPKLLTAISNAAVPFDTAHPNFLLTNFERLFSNNFIFFPEDEIQPLLTVSKTHLHLLL